MSNTTTDNMAYNEAVKEIENILREMQSENCDIDRLGENTKRAAMLIEQCRRRLVRTEEEVRAILDGFEKREA